MSLDTDPALRYVGPRIDDIPLGIRLARWPLRATAIDSDGTLAGDSHADLLAHGIEISPYSNALGALLSIGQEQPDLIVLPTVIAGADLIAFVDAVRSWTQIPLVIGITSDHSTAARAAEAVEHGADSLITLPFRTSDLLAVIRNLGFSTHRDRSALPVVAGAIVLEPQAFRCLIKGTPIDLSVREFEALYYLFTHQDRIVTPDELAATSDRGTVNGVRVLIARMRQKMEVVSSGSSSVIETVYGVGYRVVGE